MADGACVTLFSVVNRLVIMVQSSITVARW